MAATAIVKVKAAPGAMMRAGSDCPVDAALRDGV